MDMIEVKIDRRLRQVFGEQGTQVTWQWCVDTFGPPEPNGKRWAWDTIRTFWFHKEEDATLFALRWS
jgi:hypothetical protein